MMIKVGDEYLDFTGEMVIEKQLFKFDTLETAGTFSYSSTLDDTTRNRKIIGALDVTSNTNISIIENVQVLTDSGVLLYIGYIILDDPYTLEFSFFSDNNNFFARIDGNCPDVEELSDFDVNLNEENIVASWTANSGIVFPLVDRGELRQRKDAFMKLRIRFIRLDQNDWQPFIYVKDVINSIMKRSGLKISGELLQDPTYNSLITTNNNLKAKINLLEKQNIFVATETVQTIPNDVANRVKVSFELSEDLPQFNSELGNWDPVLMRWTATYDTMFRFKFHFVVSDDTKEIHWGLRKNSEAGTGVQYFTKSTTVDFTYNTYTSEAFLYAGEYVELWAYVDTGTPGTVDIISGSLQSEMLWTNMCFGRALVPNIKCTDFIADIFKMFNVIASYDSFSKTINTVLIKNISSKQETDLSRYIDSIVSIRNSDLISNYAQNNYLRYQELDNEDIEIYNQNNELPYASGLITVNNRSLEKSQDLFDVNFTTPYVYKNETFGLYLILLDYVSYQHVDGALEQDVTSVTDSAGLAQFNYAAGNVTTTNNFFIDDAQGLIQVIGGAADGVRTGGIQENDTDDQIIAIYVPNVTLPTPFRFTESVPGDTAWNIIRLQEMTTPAYDGDWENSDYVSESRSSAGVAIFAKALDGTNIDIVKQGISFGDITGMDTLTIQETYYRKIQDILNDPVTPIIRMTIPENVFLALDFTKPIRIKSEKVNGQFIINKCTGYANSYTPCTFELLKLSV